MHQTVGYSLLYIHIYRLTERENVPMYKIVHVER